MPPPLPKFAAKQRMERRLIELEAEVRAARPVLGMVWIVVFYAFVQAGVDVLLWLHGAR